MNEVNAYVTLGAGGISVVTIISLFSYVIKKILPAMARVDACLAVNDKVLENNNKAIENNTRAITEIGRSNDNVAEAIKLLTNTVTNQNNLLEKVYQKTENIECQVNRIDAYVKGKK